MPTQQSGTRRSYVTDYDLVAGICYTLIIKGDWREYAPLHDETSDHRHAFDLSMWQALLWLKYRYGELGRPDDVRAYFRPHVLYGRSEVVQGVMSQMLGYVFHTRMPYGRGVYYCNIDAESAERLLADNAIDRAVLEELARRFSLEYDHKPQDREWPPDFDFEKEFGRGRDVEA